MLKDDEPRANDTPALPRTVSEVIARDARSLARFVAASVGAGPDADALSRDVIAASFQAFTQGDQEALGRARLFAMARRRAALHVEHQRRRSGAEESRGAGPRALIAQVRPTEREALLLRYVADLPIGEVALAAGTDEVAVRQRISRALCQLSAVERGPSVASEPAEVAAMRRRVEDRLADVLDGLAPDDVADFVAEDDQARDLVHDAERMVETVRGMGSDHATDLTTLAAAVEIALGALTPAMPTKAPAPVGEAVHEEPAGVAPTAPGAAATGAAATTGTTATGAAAGATATAGSSTARGADVTTATAGAGPTASGVAAPTAAAASANGSPTDQAEASRPLSDGDVPELTPSPGKGAADNRPLVERLGARGRLAVVGGAALMLAGIMFAVSRSGSGRHGGDAWSGKVDRVSLAFGGKGGLERCSPDRAVCSPVEGGEDVPAGSTLRTDGRTRAVVLLADGTRIALDRESELRLDGDLPRRARLDHGSAVVDVSDLSASSGNRARIDVPLGFVEAVAAKMSLSVVPQRVAVEVVRGSARLVDAQERGVAVHAGEAGRLEPGKPPDVASTAYLGGAFRWHERAFGDPGQTEEITGLGELRAKKVGQDGERKGAVVLASHSTKVRIVGNVARTEVEEEFSNSTADVLEGIFRFPLPPDAQIERLALDVDGKMVDGAFVDRERASAIWRGAIVNAGEKRKPEEEIVWVPGPWRDPALLEWQRGGRFELRIYPIPKQGSRRVILAYTQVIPPDGDVRRYVYPLPHDPSRSTRVGRFDMDVQVRGHDAKSGVRPQGYAVRQETLPDGAESFTLHAEGFSPSGDLSLEFALPDAGREVTAWAYQPGPDDASGATGLPDGTSLAGASDPYVALALRPKLPLVTDGAHRSFALIVDSSRSMFGERYHRASELVTRIVREMNRDDIATVLACDSTCREIPSGPASGGPELAHAVSEFLTSVTPEGGSDVTGAVARARDALRSAAHGTARIVYVGDGTPTIGPVQPAFVRREIEAVAPGEYGSVTAVAIGADADVGTLTTMAEAGGGVVIPYTPGQSIEEAAYAVLGATYGAALADVEFETPDGLVDVSPRRLGTIPAGGEVILTARMTRPSLEGTLHLRGKVGGVPFEQRYPVRIEATTAKGNAFVPRLWAAAKIAELELALPDAESRKRAVELSGRFHVASRFTSLLVLESSAMFQAFGLDRAKSQALWTGEDDATSPGAAGVLAVADDKAEPQQEASAQNPYGGQAPRRTLSGLGSSAGESRASTAPMAAAAPMPSMPAPAPAKAKKAEAPGDSYGEAEKSAYAPAPPAANAGHGALDSALGGAGVADLGRIGGGGGVLRGRNEELGGPLELPSTPPMGRARRWVPMRKVWDRVGHVVTPAPLPASVTAEALANAERDAQGDDHRDAVKRLYTLSLLSGDLNRAGAVAERWSAKDPLDPDALTARADVAAARGERELAIRILGSVVDVRPGDHKAQWRLARLHRWAGRGELGCRHSLAVAQIRPNDANLVAEFVRCARDVGRAALANDVLAAADPATKRAADALLTKPQADPSALLGDVSVQASWSGGDDLDLALLPSDGYRVSWLGAPTRAIITARDVLSTSQEGLALNGAPPGDYVVEITRPGGHRGVVRGSIDVNAAGERRTVPFVLDGTSTRVALLKITAKSRLVPL